MLYTSQNGCLFYYDRVLYNWKIADPSMLFLLGFEAITTFDRSLSDSLNIARQVYHTYDNTVVPFEKYEIYDDIYNYLSQLNNVEDLDTYLKSNCYGLKLLLNDLTGTGDDRTIPIIFKNDINKNVIDINKMYRIEDDNKSGMSYYDLQAQKIKDIFADAAYDQGEPILIKIEDDYSDDLKNAIKEYNAKQEGLHEEKDYNSDLFRLFDYKSMYSYSLGVLYGCRCLGYDPIYLWRIYPEYWYNGTYKNLVSTAWTTFQFHYTSYIPQIDSEGTEEEIEEKEDKYKGIQINRLWNYEYSSDTELFEQSEFRKGEIKTYSASVNENTYDSINVKTVTYAPELDNPSESTLGDYLNVNEDCTSNWVPVEYLSEDSTNGVLGEDPRKGIIAADEQIITRYMIDVPIQIRKAAVYYKEPIQDGDNITYVDHYLSPKIDDTYYKYFFSTGNLGWVNFDEDQWKEASSNNNYLTFNTTSYNDINSRYLSMAVDKSNASFVGYYIVTICEENGTERNLYGIFNDFKLNENGQFDYKGSHIKYVVSDQYFNKNYSGRMPGNGYHLDQRYNLYDIVNIFVSPDGRTMWISKFPGAAKVAFYGYSDVPSYTVEAYKDISDTKTLYDNLRRYLVTTSTTVDEVTTTSTTAYYWAKQWMNSSNPNDTANRWYSKTELEDSGNHLADGIYIVDGSTDLYKGQYKIVSSTQTHTQLKSSSNELYIYNDVTNDKLPYIEGFVKIGECGLLDYGITPYVCSFITEDEHGNSLLDADGNPLVWYDSVRNKYWNGLNNINMWVDTLPVITSVFVYDASTNTTIPAYDDLMNECVTINGETITYAEFYGTGELIIISDVEYVDTISGRILYRLKLHTYEEINYSLNVDYTFYDEDKHDVTLSNNCMITSACDEYGQYVFVSYPENESLSNIIESIKFARITYV